MGTVLAMRTQPDQCICRLLPDSYSTYCANYPRAAETLKARRDDTVLQQHLVKAAKSCEHRKRVGARPPSRILEPRCRVPCAFMASSASLVRVCVFVFV